MSVTVINLLPLSSNALFRTCSPKQTRPTLQAFLFTVRTRKLSVEGAGGQGGRNGRLFQHQRAVVLNSCSRVVVYLLYVCVGTPKGALS